MGQNTFFIFLLFFLAAAGLPAEVFASVVINEIAWMGTEVDGVEPKNWWRYEWFELYNNSDGPVSLDGWKVELYRTDLDWTLELSGSISPRGYFLVVASDKISANYDLNYSNLGGKFINGGQKVFLKDNAENIIDSVDASGGWPAGVNETKQTMERTSSGWHTSSNPGGTPRAQNSAGVTPTTPETEETPQEESATTEPTTPIQEESPQDSENYDGEYDAPAKTPTPTTPATYPNKIFLNELLPSPEGPDDQEEWIELFNANDFSVDLSGWQLKDTTGSIKTHTLPEGTMLGASGFVVISRPSSKITLNNGGDGVQLIRPDNETADEVVFGKAPSGQSYALRQAQGEWQWSGTPTPGSANIIPEQTAGASSPTSSQSGEEEPEKKEITKDELELLAAAQPALSGENQANNIWFILFWALLLALLSAAGFIFIALKSKKE